MLLYSFLSLLAIFITTIAMSLEELKARDAIHLDDMDRYEAFMESALDEHFLSMYLEDNHVKVEIYHHPSNDLVRAEQFTPSANATQYFEQQERFANEHFPLEESHEEGNTTEPGIEARDTQKCSVNNLALESRAGPRCKQFCGYSSDCIRGRSACHRCYTVRPGHRCTHQKWCVQ